MDSKYLPLLKPLLEKPCFTAEEAPSIPSRMLSYYCDTGLLERIGRGVYRNPEQSLGDLAFSDLFVTAQSIPHGAICLISALAYYELTDQIMREYWIAIPNKDRSPIRPFTRIVRMRNMELGLTKEKIDHIEIAIFDRERTVVDSFRYLSDEIAIKALKLYLAKSPNLPKLKAYSKTLRVNLTPYLMALTT